MGGNVSFPFCCCLNVSQLPLINHDDDLVKLEGTRLLTRAFLEEKAHKQEMLINEGFEPEVSKGQTLYRATNTTTEILLPSYCSFYEHTDQPIMEEDLRRGQASYDTQMVKMIQVRSSIFFIQFLPMLTDPCMLLFVSYSERWRQRMRMVNEWLR